MLYFGVFAKLIDIIFLRHSEHGWFTRALP